MVSQGGYATNFGAGLGGGGTRGIEGQIVANVFKALVTRLAKSSKELKAQENMVRNHFCCMPMRNACLPLSVIFFYLSNFCIC